MSKFSFTFLTLIFFTIQVLTGAPLKDVPQSVIQPNGETLECFASGDEYHNWLHDENGFTIIQNKETGWYVYADLQRDELIPTRFVPGEDDPQKAGLKTEVNISADKVIEKRKVFEASSPQNLGNAPTEGNFNNIVIFIRFNDQDEFTDRISLYDDMFNDVSSSANSMYNYFKEVSYNQLEITTSFYPEPSAGAIVSYRDSQPRDYYVPYSATNTIGYEGDDARTEREHTLLKNAVNSIADQVPSSLNIDEDGDGYVDNVCFIIQGETEGWSSLLWPHRWALYSETASINGKRVWDYNFQLDASVYNGVLAHEMFHSLGAPDLYHYSYDGLDPAGAWDLMGANQRVPQHMGAYMKFKYGGWIDSIPEITEPGTYELNQLASSTNNFYKIASPYSSKEYFLVEYRKREGAFESSLPGEGLLVYRINPTVNGNADGPPDEVYIYRPNGTSTANGSISMAGFSGNSGRTSINDFTNPSSFLEDDSPGGLSIKNIGTIGETISFEVQMGCDLNITAPNGGDELKEGIVTKILWFGSSSEYVDIELHNSDGFFLQIAENTVNDNSYSWLPKDIYYADDYKIKVISSDDSECFDLSGSFSIVENLGIPELIAPADKSIDQSLTPILEWSELSKAEYYRVELASNALFLGSLIDDTTSSNQFQVPAEILVGERKYYWRVRAESETTIGEWSETFNFTTTIDKEIIVLSPNGGETFMAGDTIEIKWTDNIEENVRIKYLSGSSGFITDISHSTESDGSFIWIIPSQMIPRTDCMIGIESATNSDIADFTNEYFSITEKIYPPVILSQTESVVVNRGENAVFEIEADCMSGDSTGYQWVKKTNRTDDEILLVDLDGKISGATYKKLVIYNLNEDEDSTVYRCDLRNLRQYPDSGSTSQSEDILLRVKYIEIKSPGDDQIFFSDQAGFIQWETNFDEAVKIELFLGGTSGGADGEYLMTIADSASGTGYSWSAPETLESAWNYKVRISSVEDEHIEAYSEFATVVSDVKIADSDIPETFYLSECYPNPFNPTTTIEFGLPEETRVSLEVYNIAGQRIATLIDNEFKSAGKYKYKFSSSATGGNLSSGIYFYKITTDKNVAVKKMAVVK